MRVPIQRSLVEWAIARARLDREEASLSFAWLNESDETLTVNPTMKQLEKFAAAARVPIGYLFLPEPPDEEIPIPDFRTIGRSQPSAPSPDLLDTIYMAQNRQDWYRNYMLSNDIEVPDFVGSVDPGSNVEDVARTISETLKFDLKQRAQFRTWTEALSKLVEQTDQAGILVMINGVVGNNTRRKLDPEEFRGFALFDTIAPLIFVNGSDTKSAQMFTIMHEIAHIWAGRSALTNSTPEDVPSDALERWCDRVAAEVLVPISDIKEKINSSEALEDTLSRFAREYKVSTLVVLRRLFDIGLFSQDQFWEYYDEELDRVRSLVAKKSDGGGDFYNTQNFRVSRRFTRALLESTLSGKTLYGDALRLMSVSAVKTLHETARRLEVI